MKLKNRSIKTVIITTYCIIFSIIVGSVFLISFFSFSDHIKKSNDELIGETANQITYNYENYISNILKTSELIQDKLQKNDFNEELVEKYFDMLMATKQEILSIELYNPITGDLIVSDSSSTPIMNVKNTQWFDQTVFDPSIHFLTPILSQDNLYHIRFSKMIPINIKYDKVVLSFDIDFKEIIDLNYKTRLGEDGHIIVIDDFYQIIYSSQKENDPKDIQLLKDMVIGVEQYTSNNHKFTVSLSTISNSRWRLGIFYNTDNVPIFLSNFLTILIIVSVFILLIGLTLIIFISNRITKPIKNLEENMSHIDENGPRVIADISNGTKEIVSLSKTYNQMIEQINKLMKQVVIEQTNQRKSELKALQYQINPHFLYNTLDSIVWLIDNDKKEAAQSMVIALAKLFRISISRGRNIIPVRDEFEHARNYLFIQSMRYTDSFDYKIEVDEECYKYQVMKLILQPLVENCIYHGLKNRIDKGLILITGHMEGTNLIITIEDNGYGILPEDIEKLYERFNDPDLNDGVGLKNVYQRLHIYYGDKSYLKIESEVDEYTRIIISIPVEEIKDEN